MNLTTDDVLVVAAALGAVSEALSLIPRVKANGIFQLLSNILSVILRKKAN